MYLRAVRAVIGRGGTSITQVEGGRTLNILGISGQDRDAAAGLVCDGVTTAAIEEEKLGRVRHVGMTYAGGLPSRAIEFCLKSSGITFDDIDCIAYYLEPNRLFTRNLTFGVSRLVANPSISAVQSFTQIAIDSLTNRRQHFYTRRLSLDRLKETARFAFVNHQLAHAASAFYSSGFEESAILVAGNRGDMASLAFVDGSRGGLRLLKQARYPNSPGLVYDAVTVFLGFHLLSDQHKTMWLSVTGKDRFSTIFKDLLRVDKAGLPIVNLDYFDRSFKATPRLTGYFSDKIGIGPRDPSEPLTQVHRDLAASLQARIEQIVCEIARNLGSQTGHESLCMSGGLALNSPVISAVEQHAGFKRLFAYPASGNAGCSIGAALYTWHDLLGHPNPAQRIRHVFTGPVFNDDQVKGVLDNCKIGYEYYTTEERLIAEVARLLAENKIVAWFRGAMEFGPRTLGARSILASPLSELMRDNLNAFVKHREEFRPFSAAVPDRHASEFFEPSELTDFLQTVCRVKDGASGRIPAAVFGDGLARVHTVGRETNPVFWKLLVKFGEITGVPVLLNTSFNLFGEPVVSNPREAVRGFYCSGIDCLAIESFLLKK